MTFEELFPKNYKRNHSWVEIGISELDLEINDIIIESYGVSLKVIKIVDQLIKQIKVSIDNGDVKKEITDISSNDGFKFETYNIDEIVSIDNFIFDISTHLMEYGGLDDSDFEFVSTMNIGARIIFKSPNRFKLICQIPTRNFNFNEIGERILNHEIMHAWQHHKKNTGKKEREYPKWKTIYNKASNILSCGYYDENIELVAKSIYYGDLRELAAFTQQAYQDLKEITDIDSVHKKIRTLDIYKGVNSLKKCIDYLESNELPDVFDINKSILLKILKKRYYQYKKNISRLIVARKEIIEETMFYMDISKEELMLMSSF